MASPQPTDPHGVIAHDVQENILIRDFSKQQLKIIYLIIRLSWGCGAKVWQYKSYSDFKCIGLYKPDVSKNLEILRDYKVIKWIERYNLLVFEKDYDLWTIPVKGDGKDMKRLIHESLKNIGVSETLTALGKYKRSSENANTTVSETLTQPLVFSERFKTDKTTDSEVCGLPKERLNKELNIYTADFEKFYSEYPRSEDKRRTFNNWKTCLKSYSIEQLMQACMNYKSAKSGTDKQFLKSSANFLGREKPFEDYLKPQDEDNKKASQYRDLSNYDMEV